MSTYSYATQTPMHMVCTVHVTWVQCMCAWDLAGFTWMPLCMSVVAHSTHTGAPQTRVSERILFRLCAHSTRTLYVCILCRGHGSLYPCTYLCRVCMDCGRDHMCAWVNKHLYVHSGYWFACAGLQYRAPGESRVSGPAVSQFIAGTRNSNQSVLPAEFSSPSN